MKRLFAVALLALVMSLGAQTAFAGMTEVPGSTPDSPPTLCESTGGAVETPGVYSQIETGVTDFILILAGALTV